MRWASHAMDRSFYDQTDLLERELMKPTLMEAFGWKIEHVSAKEWHEGKEAVMERLLARIAESG